MGCFATSSVTSSRTGHAGNQLAVFTDARKIPEDVLQASRARWRSRRPCSSTRLNGDGARPPPDLHARVRAAVRRPSGARLSVRARGPMQAERSGSRPARASFPCGSSAKGRESCSDGCSSPCRRRAVHGQTGELLAALGAKRRRRRSRSTTTGCKTSTSSSAQVTTWRGSRRIFDASGGCHRARHQLSRPARARAGRRGCSRQRTACRRIRRPVGGRAARSPPPRHGLAASARRSRSRRAVELYRPSTLYATAWGTPDQIDRVEVGGSAVVVARGELQL